MRGMLPRGRGGRSGQPSPRGLPVADAVPVCRVPRKPGGSTHCLLSVPPLFRRLQEEEDDDDDYEVWPATTPSRLLPLPCGPAARVLAAVACRPPSARMFLVQHLSHRQVFVCHHSRLQEEEEEDEDDGEVRLQSLLHAGQGHLAAAAEAYHQAASLLCFALTVRVH